MSALIICHYLGGLDAPDNNRFNYLADTLYDEKIDFDIVTSSFSHFQKKQRKDKTSHKGYKVTQIYEPGYRSNISLRRYYSHYKLGKNLAMWLDHRPQVPDLIYCAVPSLSVAEVAARYAKKHGVRFILDIQDLWPEAFEMFIRSPTVAGILFSRMHRQAQSVYLSADEIVSVSKTFLDRIRTRIPHLKTPAHVVYLGTDLASFDANASANRFLDKPENEIWAVYLGTLSHSYDLTLVIDACDRVAKRGHGNLRLIIIGDGPFRQKFENYAKSRVLPCWFVGRMPFAHMAGLLSICDIAFNPIVARSGGSVINKVSDYAAAGLPVINTQENAEYRELLNRYKAGINCGVGDTHAVSEALELLLESAELRREMGENSRRLALEQFDRQVIYQPVFDMFRRRRSVRARSTDL